jgi:hypothetical protein
VRISVEGEHVADLRTGMSTVVAVDTGASTLDHLLGK